MEYDKKILDNLGVLNEVLIELQKPPAFENYDFCKGEMDWEGYLQLCFKKESFPDVSISFSLYDIQVDLDRITEAYIFSNAYIAKNRSQVKDILKDIFTRHLQIKYCGTNYTKFFFSDSTGKVVRTLRVTGLLYLKLKCASKQYTPFYE